MFCNAVIEATRTSSFVFLQYVQSLPWVFKYDGNRNGMRIWENEGTGDSWIEWRNFDVHLFHDRSLASRKHTRTRKPDEVCDFRPIHPGSLIANRIFYTLSVGCLAPGNGPKETETSLERQPAGKEIYVWVSGWCLPTVLPGIQHH